MSDDGARHRWCVVAVAIAGASLALAWVVEALVIPLVRPNRTDDTSALSVR